MSKKQGQYDSQEERNETRLQPRNGEEEKRLVEEAQKPKATKRY